MAKTKSTKSSPKKTKSRAKSPAKAPRKTAGAKGAKARKVDGADAVAADQPEGAKRPSKAAAPRAPLTPKTFFANKQNTTEQWRLVDAAGQPLGRLSTYIASALMGKDKPSYTRHSDTGDFVIVVNAEKVVLTGNKLRDKLYQYHTNYPGGLKTQTAQEVMDKHPDRIIRSAVYGMLPKGHMGRHWYKKLRVFAGADHPHQAQKPVAANLPNMMTRETDEHGN